MRARAAFLAGAGSAAILAVGWNAGVAAFSNSSTVTSAPAAAGTSGGASSSTTVNSSTTSSTPSSTPTPTAPSGPADGTYQGQAVPYQFGTVQVNVVVAGGKISDVQFAQATATRGRDQAFPMLVSETLTAQSANISNISGATFTTMAYQQALQSALDAAGWQG